MYTPQFYRQSSESSIASNDSLDVYLTVGFVLEESQACLDADDLLRLLDNEPLLVGINNTRNQQAMFDPAVCDQRTSDLLNNTGEWDDTTSCGLGFFPQENPPSATNTTIPFSPTLRIVEQNPFQPRTTSPLPVQIQQYPSLHAVDDPYQSPPGSPPSPVNTNIHDWLVTDDTSKRKRRPLLYEFLRQLLDNPNYSHIAEYVDAQKGIFKLKSPKEVASLWKFIKGRNSDISIILAFYKRNPVQISEAIENLDSQRISIELVQHLIQYAANETEIEAFRHVSVDKEKLSPADRLMYEVVQVPFYTERLVTLRFQLTFVDTSRLLTEQLRLVNEACTFLCQSTQLKKLLEILLSVINHVNQQQTSLPLRRTLSPADLSKIQEMKTPKTRVPIMKIVSEICTDRHSEIFGLKQNYALILSASKIELATIKLEIEQMKQKLEQIQIWIQMDKFKNKTTIQEFITDSEATLREMNTDHQRTVDQVNTTVVYFTNETATKTASNEFLSSFASLIQSLQPIKIQP